MSRISVQGKADYMDKTAEDVEDEMRITTNKINRLQDKLEELSEIYVWKLSKRK